MARTPSNMLPLGTKAPEFSLFDTISDASISFNEIQGKNGTVIMFICNHCPFVIHVNSEIISIAKTYKDKGIGFAAISSNDVVNYPQDSPENMKAHAKNEGYPFPYLYDESQEIAKAYDAACTPDFYVFNSNDKLVYRGQLDDSRPDNGKPLNGADLRNALDCLIEEKENTLLQKPSIGCNIKWKV
ncbi:thioredoxin family protein [Seonamhaeicola sediminis]|uniref:Thioredoxin family protein n=1 Tax=Seonamhaeicola sediminis TaxID=2528206 RepID=A0A562YI11_9FLAO|nr:thioredoxin family protein [Seonamhaeicola sediminis]TWO34347.1 thioredoxin family protein [Seonamhaeicola sediminis]